MKRVIQPHIDEIAEYYCDKHHDVRAYFQVTLEGGYGSGHDLQVCKLHLCDECAEKTIKLLLEEFGQSVKFNEITL